MKVINKVTKKAIKKAMTAIIMASSSENIGKKLAVSVGLPKERLRKLCPVYGVARSTGRASVYYFPNKEKKIKGEETPGKESGVLKLKVQL